MNFNEVYIKFYDCNKLCILRGNAAPTINMSKSAKMDNLLCKSSIIDVLHLCNMAFDDIPLTPPTARMDTRTCLPTPFYLTSQMFFF